MLRDLSEILLTEEQIQARVQELGTTITQACKDLQAEELTVICVTSGSILFTADLIRQIQLHVRLDCIQVSSYQNKTHAVTEPQILSKLKLDIPGRHVLLVDDILDTGKTLKALMKLLNKENPASLRTCVLLNKQERREVDITADLIGFEIPNEFVVGYGLDFAERYRNLPYIGVLKKELQGS